MACARAPGGALLDPWRRTPVTLSGISRVGGWFQAPRGSPAAAAERMLRRRRQDGPAVDSGSDVGSDDDSDSEDSWAQSGAPRMQLLKLPVGPIRARKSQAAALPDTGAAGSSNDDDGDDGDADPIDVNAAMQDRWASSRTRRYGFNNEITGSAVQRKMEVERERAEHTARRAAARREDDEDEERCALAAAARPVAIGGGFSEILALLSAVSHRGKDAGATQGAVPGAAECEVEHSEVAAGTDGKATAAAAAAANVLAGDHHVDNSTGEESVALELAPEELGSESEREIACIDLEDDDDGDFCGGGGGGIGETPESGAYYAPSGTNTVVHAEQSPKRAVVNRSLVGAEYFELEASESDDEEPERSFEQQGEEPADSSPISPQPPQSAAAKHSALRNVELDFVAEMRARQIVDLVGSGRLRGLSAGSSQSVCSQSVHGSPMIRSGRTHHTSGPGSARGIEPEAELGIGWGEAESIGGYGGFEANSIGYGVQPRPPPAARAGGRHVDRRATPPQMGPPTAAALTY